MAPVIFDRRQRKIAPYSIAPWCLEQPKPKLIPLLESLRGDFFCMPFGANAQSFRGEQHPVHGETANSNWKLVGYERVGPVTELHLQMATKIRPGRVDKRLRLINGHNAVYCQHRVQLAAGPMSFGYHAMLKCGEEPNSAYISTSRIVHGQVFPEPTEAPENRGYSLLQPGAVFDCLESVPTITSATADLSQYPSRRGYEDIVQVLSDPENDFAWSAVSFPADRYVWFTLKDPRMLTGTVFWFSNGGRHYPPWNGRHVGVVGIEEVTGYFVYGLQESARRNSHNSLGVKTALTTSPDTPLDFKVISGVALTPRGFGKVQSIERSAGGVTLTSSEGQSVAVPLDVEFLYSK